MAEIGVVKEIDMQNNIATIEFKASGPCKGCGVCLVGTASEVSLMQVKVKNVLGAKIGDRVEFEVKEGETFKASLLLYGFPLGLLLLGFMLGQKIAGVFAWSKDILGLVFAGIFFAGAFYVLSLLEKGRAGGAEHITLLRII